MSVDSVAVKASYCHHHCPFQSLLISVKFRLIAKVAIFTGSMNFLLFCGKFYKITLTNEFSNYTILGS